MLKSDYSQAKSLKEATKICRQSLISDGREDYAELITEQRVGSAIKTALESYKYILEEKSKPYGEDYSWMIDEEVKREIRYFEDVAKPLYLDIVHNGSWLPGNSFFYCLFREDDNLVRYDGLGLRLQIETPGRIFSGFSIPILDLYYGCFTSTKEKT